MAHAGHEHLDPEHVAAYDLKQGYPDPSEDLEIFAVHGLGSHSSLLDVGPAQGSSPSPPRDPTNGASYVELSDANGGWYGVAGPAFSPGWNVYVGHLDSL